MFFRVKPAGSYRYLQIAHSVREGQKVRQQVIATLGRLDLLEASGQLERLMRSGLRHCEKFAVIDAHAAGEIQPVAIRRIGPDLVFARLWKESGIPEVLRSLKRLATMSLMSECGCAGRRKLVYRYSGAAELGSRAFQHAAKPRIQRHSKSRKSG